MANQGVAAVLPLLLLALHARCDAQGFTLIEKCPATLKPVATREASLPLTGKYNYHVVARFAIDVDGSVVAPRVQESRLLLDSGTVEVPANVDAAFLAALAQWRYERRPKPCAGTVELTIRSSI
jgi:hypothetical protein